MNNMYKNSISSLCSQFLYLVTLFCVRCVFIRALGIEYQGLDSVMASLVAILSLADLGIGTASVFALYEPISLHQKEKICSLMSLYKKMYLAIISFLLIVGMIVCILVPRFIKDSIFSDLYIRKIFVLFLLQTISTYIFAEYQTLLLANEKNYINSIYKSIVYIVSAILQIIVIVTLNNYYLKILTITICNLATNFLIRYKALKTYPYLKTSNSNLLTKKEKLNLFNDFKNLSISKIADILIFQTDNLLISSIIGEVIVGIYSNYYLIITGINSIINCLITAIQPSFASKLLKNNHNSKTQSEIFNSFSTISLMISSICICGYYLLFDDFISIWVGSTNILNRSTVLLLIITQIIILLDNPFWAMMYLNGAFKQIKNIGFFVSIINIIASLLLGNIVGLNGIVYGTIICYSSSITLHFIYVFKSIIPNRKTFFLYFIKLLKFLLSSILSISVCMLLYNHIVNYNHQIIINFAIKVLVCITFTLTINLIVYSKNLKALINAFRKDII